MNQYHWTSLYPGIWRVQTAPDPVTVTGIAGVSPSPALQKKSETEFPDGIDIRKSGRYTVIRIPLGENEQVFGCGLLFHSVISRNKVYHLRVDHSSGCDNGRGHAPIPFAVTSSGTGIFCNSPYPVDIYVGTAQRMEDKKLVQEHDRATDPNWSCYNAPFYIEMAANTSEAEFILFRGNDLKDCTARFNLFCGGGCLPPKWGFGVWHRTNMSMTAQDILNVAKEYREHDFPLSVLGFEPGWQSGSYPCTYDWSEKNFPDPAGLLEKLKNQGIRVNLWENPYISERSSVYRKILPYCGSHLVWCGAVPDYTIPEAREILREHHKKTHFDIGVSGYKLDESDGFDAWLWPDHAEFPSGLSGLAVRNTCGLLFQKLTYEIYHGNNRRTYGLTRSTAAGGVSFPYVIYNDRYDYSEYIAGLCSCGFTGALWCPELRDGSTPLEWLRRFQLAALSPVLLLNAWANNATPWMYPEVKNEIRDAVMLRKKLLPYLYSAFARYHFEGIPPYRAVFMDHGMFIDQKTGQGELDPTENPYQLVKKNDIADQFTVGDSLMAAPMPIDKNTRSVIFPPGKWYDFHSGEFVSDGGVLEIRRGEKDPLPLFAPDGAVVPLDKNGSIEIRKFGTKPGKFMLYEDDGETFGYEHGGYHWTELKA